MLISSPFLSLVFKQFCKRLVYFMAIISPVATSAFKAYLRPSQINKPTPTISSNRYSGISGSFKKVEPTSTISSNRYSGISGSFKKVEPTSSLSDKLFGALRNSPIKDSLDNIADNLATAAKPIARNSVRISSGSSGGGAPSAAALDYLNADLAKYYGMDQTTAYNEALSNTAYQRAVKDMQDAGLNPAVLFGNGRVSGADGVFGAKPLSASSGGSSGRSFGRSGRSGKLFSSSTYGMISGLGSLAGAGIAAATGGSVGLGALTGSNIATSAAKVLNGLWNKR